MVLYGPADQRQVDCPYGGSGSERHKEQSGYQHEVCVCRRASRCDPRKDTGCDHRHACHYLDNVPQGRSRFQDLYGW